MISITLPSLHHEALGEALDNILDMTFNPCQVIVVSPFPVTVISGQHEVVWVEEKEPAGCAAAHATAATRATGEFITAWADDHLYVKNWDVLARDDFLTREALFESMSPGKVFALGLRRHGSDYVGTQFGMYYPWFPFMRRSDVWRCGGWLHAAYKVGFSDGDLGMRVWASGGRCEWSGARLVMTGAQDKRKGDSDEALYVVSDMSLFVEKWGKVFGTNGWDTGTLRGFNIDVIPEQVPQLVDWSGRSIKCNDATKFKQAVGR